MCMEGWEQIDTGIDAGLLYESGLVVCVKYEATSRTWSDAIMSCRNQYGHLLLLDDSYYQIPTTTLGDNLYNYMQSQGEYSPDCWKSSYFCFHHVGRHLFCWRFIRTP